PLGGTTEIMNQSELVSGSVFFAVGGVFIAATRIPDFVTLLSILAASSSGFDRSVAISEVIGNFLGISFGILLFIYRNTLARRLFGTSPSAPMSLRDFQSVAFSVLGRAHPAHKFPAEMRLDPHVRRRLGHVLADRFPDVEGLATPEWADVVTAFEQYGILESLSNGPRVVFDAGRKLLGGQVCLVLHNAGLQNKLSSRIQFTEFRVQ
ncbi:MAG: hypothetical protein KGJ55_08970, partial [Gammaproteobacteria bacterium]|nr:hypothetical protein [Gammaproteobacteria bacterium]